MYERITPSETALWRTITGGQSATTARPDGSSLHRQEAQPQDERGAALVLMSLCLAMVLVATMLLAAVGERTVARARAQSAADASSLAGVSDGRSAAAELATNNGARLVSFEEGDNEVSVVVEFDGVRAAASAERRLALDPGE